ncbi:integral membrane protein S linking to the trans Golgi network-domain-containing protein [Rhizophagus clarus]|uniref:Integral membrane protein S linking to the trans Golgi network-domain-containing protein n=1 Tax=Rhizophagus clarus TaxID=94130 RepID=A0A8H3QEM5_9GLOM|nr:integral membrane protein S linking to the trans Golgi network-domain-containing protein [Rhizophagus clarus]
MSYRAKFRSWNAEALKKPEESDKINDSLSKDNQRPRRESWSQPPQRGKITRGRGTWKIDNRPGVYRRHTVPNSHDFQDNNCNYGNRWEDDNPIAEEPRNLSNSPGSDCDYAKENDRENCDYQNHKENFPRKSINNESDQVWTHDKYESLELDQKDAKNASAPVSPLNINNEILKNNNIQEVPTCDFSQKINKPESPKDQTKTNSVHPNVITVKFCDLTGKGTNEELKADVNDLVVVTEVIPKPTIPEINSKATSEVTNEASDEVTNEASDEVANEATDEITNEATDQTDEVNIEESPKMNIEESPKMNIEESPKVNIEASPKMNIETSPKVNPEAKSFLGVIPEAIIEVPPVEEVPLINLDEVDNTITQSIQTKISEDILTLDWESYQKDLMEQELKLNLKRRTIQTPSPRFKHLERRFGILFSSFLRLLHCKPYHLLDYREFRADTVLGWTIGFAWIANSVVGIFILVRLIQRARLVLDFSLTLHFFHLLITTYYSGHVPTTFIWWALNVTTCCIMIFGGEIYCMRKEMEPIPLSDDIGEGASGASGSSVAVKTKTSADVERDRYEMVPMEEIEVGGG